MTSTTGTNEPLGIPNTDMGREPQGPDYVVHRVVWSPRQPPPTSEPLLPPEAKVLV